MQPNQQSGGLQLTISTETFNTVTFQTGAFCCIWQPIKMCEDYFQRLQRQQTVPINARVDFLIVFQFLKLSQKFVLCLYYLL